MSRVSVIGVLVVAFACALAVPAASTAAPASAKARQGGPAACAAARVAVRAATLDDARRAVLCLLNRHRAQRKLPPLRPNPRLQRAARGHSRDMVRRGYFSHESPNGRSILDRARAVRYVPRSGSWALGENIGWGTGALGQPAALVRAWMRSPSHRSNILNPRFREIGIGIAIGVPVRDRALAARGGATYTTDFGYRSAR